ncbi:unnamed protein product [Effrenium voratum]|nr:unnamed protein product [Effrenium voratum]
MSHGVASSAYDPLPTTAEVIDPAANPRKWLAPALLLLCALFCQNAGLYSATCQYVRAADEAEGDSGYRSGLKRIEHSALADVGHDLLKSSQLAESLEGISWAPEIWVDLLTDLVILALGLWLVRSKDLRSWTQLALSCSALAVLKGILASTVFPDATGWLGCKRRLGPDGMMYFRQSSSHLSAFSALCDILLLTLQSLWLLGRAAPQQLCSDTLFCCSTSTTVLVCLGAYDAVSRSLPLEDTRRERRSAILGLTGIILCSILAADVALAVGSKLHYSVDVVLALPLASLMYANPAVAMAASDWAETKTPTAFSSPKAEADLGMVPVSPCCFPFANLAGRYFLQTKPFDVSRPRWTADEQRRHRQKKTEMTNMIEATRRRCRDLEAALQAQAQAAQRLAARRKEAEEELRSSASEQEADLAALRAQLQAEQKAVAELKLPR